MVSDTDLWGSNLITYQCHAKLFINDIFFRAPILLGLQFMRLKLGHVFTHHFVNSENSVHIYIYIYMSMSIDTLRMASVVIYVTCWQASKWVVLLVQMSQLILGVE
jgi:hypothetical protein